jgi:hypothetical protein
VVKLLLLLDNDRSPPRYAVIIDGKTHEPTGWAGARSIALGSS